MSQKTAGAPPSGQIHSSASPRDDLYVVLALLGDLDRILSPLALEESGTVGGPPVIPPPLPTASSPGSSRPSGRGRESDRTPRSALPGTGREPRAIASPAKLGAVPAGSATFKGASPQVAGQSPSSAGRAIVDRPASVARWDSHAVEYASRPVPALPSTQSESPPRDESPPRKPARSGRRWASKSPAPARSHPRARPTETRPRAKTEAAPPGSDRTRLAASATGLTTATKNKRSAGPRLPRSQSGRTLLPPDRRDDSHPAALPATPASVSVFRKHAAADGGSAPAATAGAEPVWVRSRSHPSPDRVAAKPSASRPSSRKSAPPTRIGSLPAAEAEGRRPDVVLPPPLPVARLAQEQARDAEASASTGPSQDPPPVRDRSDRFGADIDEEPGAPHTVASVPRERTFLLRGGRIRVSPKRGGTDWRTRQPEARWMRLRGRRI
jgi:hypothetical protein